MNYNKFILSYYLFFNIEDKTHNNEILLNFCKNYNFVKLYENFKLDRFKIIKDHKGNISGIYMLYNKTNNCFYIGSSINIAGRMRNYLNISNLKLKQNSNMPIVKALLKYDHSNFALFILEYLPIINLAERETY